MFDIKIFKVVVCLSALANAVDTGIQEQRDITESTCEAKPNVFVDPKEDGICVISSDCNNYPFYDCVNT